MWRKLQGREGKLLSQVGREVLIKSVYKLSLPMLWVVSSSHWACAMKLRFLYASFGGDNEVTKGRSIGSNGMR